MNNESFIENYLWIIVLVILLFTAFVGYTLNKNIDPDEIDEEEEDEFKENTHED